MILAESLAVEEHAIAQPQRLVEIRVLEFSIHAFDVDAEFLDEPRCDRTVGPRTLDHQSAAVHEMRAAVQVELVALGVSAEVVVIVEDQDSRIARVSGSKKVRGGEAAEATAD